MRVDLPEPDTPVTDTKQPSGMSTSTLRRLFSRAPLIEIQSSPGSRRSSGTGIDSRWLRYLPVIDFRLLRRPATLPE